MVAGAGNRIHILNCTLRRECEFEIAQVFTLLKPTSSEILPSTSPYTLSLPKLCHRLSTKYSMLGIVEHLSLKPSYQFTHFCYKQFGSFHDKRHKSRVHKLQA